MSPFDELVRLGVRVAPWGAEYRLTYLDGTGECFAELPQEAIAMARKMAAERPIAPPVIRTGKYRRPLSMKPKAARKRWFRNKNRRLRWAGRGKMI